MKVSANQYAWALFEALDGKTEKETKSVLRDFVALLGQKRDLNKAEEIVDCFSRLWEKKRGEAQASVASARRLSRSVREEMVSFLQERTGAKEISLSEEIDEKLLGGFVLKYGSQVLDGSLKSSLESLEGKMSN